MPNRLETCTHASGAGGYLIIDLNALTANYRLLSSKSGKATTGAVIKADAYGLGARQVSTALYAAGCRHFFVAQALEAFDLRPHLPADSALYVLNGLPEGCETSCAARGIIPVLNSLNQIMRWSAVACEHNARLPAVVQFDTGMTRLGLTLDEARALAAAPEVLAPMDVRFIMSHLACADTPDNTLNAAQLTDMHIFRALFPHLPVSFANSGGVFMGEDYLQDFTRPGIALFGGAPNDAPHNPMQPVVSLNVAVIQTRNIPAGTRIGYGGSYIARCDMRLATIAAGYADGLPRSLSPGGAAWFDGIRLPMVGRISMDSLMLDISALPDDLPAGSFVELIGPHQSIDDIAADAGTISYEILTGLGRRFYREYVGLA